MATAGGVSNIGWHGSTRAALIYQHATSERDQQIAAELSRRAIAAREKAEKEAREKAKKSRGDQDGEPAV